MLICGIGIVDGQGRVGRLQQEVLQSRLRGVGLETQGELADLDARLLVERQSLHVDVK